MKSCSFTLVELLVVIAVIFILIGLTLSSVTHAKRKSKDLVCLNNLRQLSLACNYYKNDYDSHPIMKRWLDDFRPLYDYAPYYDLYVCPFDEDTIVSKRDDLCGDASFLYLGTYEEAQKGESLEKRWFRHPYLFSLTNGLWIFARIISLKTHYECLYDRRYYLHPYGINVVYMDGHGEKAKNNYHRFWLLEDNDRIVWSMWDFPDLN